MVFLTADDEHGPGTAQEALAMAFLLDTVSLSSFVLSGSRGSGRHGGREAMRARSRQTVLTARRTSLNASYD
jgi:hypothetical protein